MYREAFSGPKRETVSRGVQEGSRGLKKGEEHRRGPSHRALGPLAESFESEYPSTKTATSSGPNSIAFPDSSRREIGESFPESLTVLPPPWESSLVMIAHRGSDQRGSKGSSKAGGAVEGGAGSAAGDNTAPHSLWLGDTILALRKPRRRLEGGAGVSTEPLAADRESVPLGRMTAAEGRVAGADSGGGRSKSASGPSGSGTLKKACEGWSAAAGPPQVEALPPAGAFERWYA